MASVQASGSGSPSGPLEPAGALFVHDFVGIDVGLETIVSSLRAGLTPAALSALIEEAWGEEIFVLDEVNARTSPHQRPLIAVRLGRLRARRDAVIVPVAWWTLNHEWVPPLDADLEIAAFGPTRTHLHLLGQSRLPPGEVPLSAEASLSHRFTVAFVRHVLTLLAEQISPPPKVPAQIEGQARSFRRGS